MKAQISVMPSNYQGRTGVLLFEHLGILSWLGDQSQFVCWTTNLSANLRCLGRNALSSNIFFRTKQNILPVDLTGIMIEVSSWLKSFREILRLDKTLFKAWVLPIYYLSINFWPMHWLFLFSGIIWLERVPLIKGLLLPHFYCLHETMVENI